MGPSGRVLDVLTRIFPPDVEFQVVDVQDRRITVEIQGGSRLDGYWLARGWPRQVREALDSLSAETATLLIAPVMSPGARSLAERAGVGWADERGAASLALGSIIVSREPGRRQSREPDRSSWKPSTLAAAEALLTGTRATVTDVAARTELAEGTVTQALRLLTDAGFLMATAARGRLARRWLHDPSGLLDVYAEEAIRLRNDLTISAGVDSRESISQVLEAGDAWTRASRPWAATGALAAHFQGPYLQSPAPLEVYVDATSPAGLEAAALEAGLPVIEGGRLTLRPFPSRGTSRQSVVEAQQGLTCRCVPWPRTFADLRVTGVRGEDAADHLRDLHLPTPEKPDD